MVAKKKMESFRLYLLSNTYDTCMHAETPGWKSKDIDPHVPATTLAVSISGSQGHYVFCP